MTLDFQAGNSTSLQINIQNIGQQTESQSRELVLEPVYNFLSTEMTEYILFFYINNCIYINSSLSVKLFKKS